jgi:hypothetical protein
MRRKDKATNLQTQSADVEQKTNRNGGCPQVIQDLGGSARNTMFANTKGSLRLG